MTIDNDRSPIPNTESPCPVSARGSERLKPEKKNPAWALVCQGGGGKGAWEAGFIYQAATKYDYSFKSCFGTSVGGLNCALYFQCVKTGNYKRLRELWESLSTWSIVGIPRLHELLRFGFSTHKKLTRIIQKNLPKSDLKVLFDSGERFLFLSDGRFNEKLLAAHMEDAIP